MSLDTANGAPTGSLPTAIELATAVVTTVTATPSSTAMAAPVAGDADNSQHASTSSTVMIAVGCVIGILGVAGVICLIWWMRKRALAQQTYMVSDDPRRYPPPPPVKSAALAAQKNLPVITPATRTGRSGTMGSADKDKALPIKPPESVWSPTGTKSPAATSIHEMTVKSKGRSPEEISQVKERSNSIGSFKAPQNFI